MADEEAAGPAALPVRIEPADCGGGPAAGRLAVAADIPLPLPLSSRTAFVTAVKSPASLAGAGGRGFCGSALATACRDGGGGFEAASRLAVFAISSFGFAAAGGFSATAWRGGTAGFGGLAASAFGMGADSFTTGGTASRMGDRCGGSAGLTGAGFDGSGFGGLDLDGSGFDTGATFGAGLTVGSGSRTADACTGGGGRCGSGRASGAAGLAFGGGALSPLAASSCLATAFGAGALRGDPLSPAITRSTVIAGSTITGCGFRIGRPMNTRASTAACKHEE
jgi:hypothetical protein